MFKKAFQVASEFTRPVVMTRRSVDGRCGCGNGAFIVINDEGWALTAAHIVRQISDLQNEEQGNAGRDAAAAKIRSDASLTDKARRSKLQALGKVDPSSTRNASVWWGGVADGLEELFSYPSLDLAIIKLRGFRAGSVTQFPVFKGPEGIDSPGTSLCKLGYPFFTGHPEWDEGNRTFTYPPDELPPALFPIEGMMTRLQSVKLVDSDGKPVHIDGPLQFLETSTPGLKGQSGGPIFDATGVIWAIQCLTTHLDLGFEAKLHVNGKEHTEHQFINLGLGPASNTIIYLLNKHGISHAKFS
ncbi:trypsin-like peptidase domain-containing protein [Xanthomonas arboricola]|uniref:trypsin-like peptidase domain-containing protein n=1 Tax=Xanthomonas arboricola TaxID=56448 RepID=UPI003EBF9939